MVRSTDHSADHAPDIHPAQRVDPVTDTDWLTAGAIAVVFYLIGLWRLGTPPKTIFDEVYHARTGMQYIYGSSLTEWTHPPLAKLLIALSMLCWHVRFDPRDGFWKDSTTYSTHAAFAWRFPSLVFGTGALILLYILARTMFGRRDIAITATCLLALDGVFFVQSRVAMTNIFTVFFVLLSTLGTYRFIKTNRYPNLLLTGVGLAFALATRWSTLFVWGLTGIALLYHLFTELLPRWRAQITDARNTNDAHALGRCPAVPVPSLGWKFAVWAAMAALCLIVLPIAVYVLSYVPNVLAGGGDWKIKLFTWKGLGGQQSWEWTLGMKEGLQHNMWGYHSGIKDKHPYSSMWWSWPLMLRPVWYFYEGSKNVVNGVWAIGNAFIWWLSVPALAAAAYLGGRERRPALALIALFGLGQWLLWGREPRSLTFMHYFFESIPYACLALAYLGWRLWDYGGPWGRRAVGGLALLTIAWAIFYYPLLSAYPISDSYYQMHLWMGSRWI